MTRLARLALALALVPVLAKSAEAQGRSGSDSPGQQALSDGQKALESDDFASAETKFKEAIRLDPKLNDAYWRLAAVLYGKKQYAQAVELLRRAPEKTDLDVREQLGLALYKTATPPPAESVRLLEEVVQQRPSAYSAQLQLGQFLVRSDPKRAASALESYLRSRPSSAASLDPQIHMVLGTAYVYGKDWAEAQREFEGILKVKPGDMPARLMLGSVLVGKNACSQAISLYERVLSEASRQPSIYYNLGTCYLREKRAADALREAQLYVRAKPSDAKGHVLVCDALYDAKDYSRALTECQAAERLDAVNPVIKGKIGRAYLAMRSYQSAVTSLEQAVAGQRANGAPKDPETLGALAEAYAAVKAPREKLSAIADELASLKDAKALAAAGQVYFLAGRDERASQVLGQSLAADPSNLGAKKSLVLVLNRRAGAAVERGDVGGAERELTEAARLLPEDLMTGRNLGLVLLLARRPIDAEQVLSRALRKVPNDLVINRLVARAQLLERKISAATASYEKAAQQASRTRGPELSAIYAELGPLYLEQDKLDQAVNVLEIAVKEAGQTPISQVAQRNLAIAYFKRGQTRLRDPKLADAALDDMVAAGRAPKGVLTMKEQSAFACGEAMAALHADKIPQAEDAWEQAVKLGGEAACVFRPPFDKLGTRFFVAYTQYRDGANALKREAAVKLFTQLVAKATGNSADWLRVLLRSGYELLAYDFYQRSDERRAGQFLASATRVPAKSDRRELEHNLAVVELASGKTGQAEKVFDALGARPCEARINLGIVRDRQGESRKALELYKQAKACGARSPKLNEWIDVKERLFGANP